MGSIGRRSGSLGRAVCLALLVAVLLGWGAASAAGRVYFAEYKGEAQEHDRSAYTDGDYDFLDETFSWDLKVYYDDSNSTSQYTLVAQGSESYGNSAQTTSCQISQKATNAATNSLVIGHT
jgi:hypothetical protein